MIGLLAWWLVPWMRRQTLGNLAIAFGAEKSEAERRRIGRRCYRLAGRGLLAWPVLHRMGRERAAELVSPTIAPAAAELLASGKGAIWLTQHSGLFELGGVWASLRHGVVAVGRDAGEDPGTNILIAMREDMGLKTIEQGNAREILRVLRGGGLVAMLADQDIRRVNGAFVPFFGKLAHTPVGPAALAVRLKVPILCAVTEWRTLTRHGGSIAEILRPREDLSNDDAVLELTARCTAAIEAAVRRRPDEWLWMHDRWRVSPEEMPDQPVWPPEMRAAAGAGPATPSAGGAAPASPAPGGAP
jgi:KDO2-lipid IV(A) lauroyltransferase